MLAELQLSTVAYCQQDLSQDDWTTIIQHMTQSAAALAVLFEDQVHFQLKCQWIPFFGHREVRKRVLRVTQRWRTAPVSADAWSKPSYSDIAVGAG